MEVQMVGLELKPLYTVDIPTTEAYIYGVESAGDLFLNTIGKRNTESVAVLCLDNCNRIINYSIVATGSISHVRVQLAELFKVALLSNAVKIIVAHNHPSGVLKINDHDITMTKNIGVIARLFDIELIDSIIINSKGELISIREEISHTKESTND